MRSEGPREFQEFQDSVLYISARSPFARRVRLAFIENGIRYREQVFNVFQPAPELLSANPLGRVPVLVLRSGETVIDSNVILSLLYSSGESRLIPPPGPERLLCARWSALGAGLCEKTVEYFLETQRPEAARDPEVTEEFVRVADATLALFESEISGRSTICAHGLSQADLDMGAALAYICLRHSSQWRERYPSASAFLERMEGRESFRRTVPPPP